MSDDAGSSDAGSAAGSGDMSSQASASTPVVATGASTKAPAAPLREDQIGNAVKFLSHPSVSSSPEQNKKDFLRKKGLTDAEIAEAFRRVGPGTTPAAPQYAAPVQQYAPPGQYAPPQGMPAQQIVPAQPQSIVKPVLLATSAVVGIGGLFAYLAHMYFNRNGKGDDSNNNTGSSTIVKVEEVETVALPDAGLVKVSTEIDNLKQELSDLAKSIDSQTKELKSGFSSIERLTKSIEDERKEAAQKQTKQYDDLKSELKSTFRESNAPSTDMSSIRDDISSLKQVVGKLAMSTAAAAAQPQPQGQSQRRPPSMPSPSQSPASSSKAFNPFEAVATGNVPPEVSEAMNGKAGGDAAAPPAATAEATPYSKSFIDVMNMVQNGETPPGIRQIDSTPPDPNVPLKKSTKGPPTKPWQRKGKAPATPPQTAPSTGPSSNGDNQFDAFAAMKAASQGSSGSASDLINAASASSTGQGSPRSAKAPSPAMSGSSSPRNGGAGSPRGKMRADAPAFTPPAFTPTTGQ
eukprot:GFYU01005008.1.p1 GENE.GFYU01005008.1~~GFYU01005008.1.p1  ORF type:complete len:533 (-),score=112.70 GFYU01005008.1:80-1636(-)